MKKSQIEDVYCTLLAARLLLDEPENWTNHFYATKDNGLAVHPIELTATSFCSIGATMAVDPGLMETGILNKLAEKELDKTIRGVWGDTFGIHSMIAFNDAPKTKHKDILKVFDMTIERLEAELYPV